MKKIAAIAFAVVAVLSITGFGVAEVAEYFQVARHNVNESIRESIPLDVEIDRMELLLKKMDQQVSKQKYQVAKSRVALEDAESEMVRDHKHAELMLANMRKLRDLQSGGQYVQVGCHKVTSGEVRQALANHLAAYKSKTIACEARETAVTQQRKAYQSLKQRYDEWNQQRQLLSHRLETLRSRLAAQKATANTDVVTIDSSELDRATQLAGRIETRLRIAETQQALGTDPVDSILNATTETRDVEAEVDALLGNDVTAAK